MTEYWKSYAKKFCEICKVWYADNRVSIERHEQGPKHKAMVQQRLRESAKKAKDKEVENHDLRMTILAMEQAAKASMNSQEERSVPVEPEPKYAIRLQKEEKDGPDQKEEVREQKRKLKELKRKAKQSQYWVDDQPNEQLEGIAELTGGIEWVRSDTSDEEPYYYWHITSGETRWDQPERFYTASEYAERYEEIAAEMATKAHFSANGTQDKNPSYYEQSSSASAVCPQNYYVAQPGSRDQIYSQMISPQLTPQISNEKAEKYKEQPPAKRTFKERDFQSANRFKQEPREEESKLSREERRKIRRERKAMAEAEEVKAPEGLVELKVEMAVDLLAGEGSSSTKAQNYSHPLGAWVPVKKEEPPRPDLEQQKLAPRKEKQSKRFDDLPEQEYGPGTAVLAKAPAELLEIADIDPGDLSFREKQISAGDTAKQKKAKVVGFRKPAGNSANKSLRIAKND